MKVTINKETGLGEPVNFHKKIFTGGAYNAGESIEYHKFAKENPPLTVKNQQLNTIKEGTFDCEKIWIMYDDNDGYEEWSETSCPERDKANGYRVKEVYRVITQPEVKETVEEAVYEFANNLVNSKYKNRDPNYLAGMFVGVIEGAQWQQSNLKDKVIAEIEKAIINLESKYSKGCVTDNMVISGGVVALTDLINVIKELK